MRRTLAVGLALGWLVAGWEAEASIWPSSERRVERALADTDAAVRRRAALELATLPRGAARRLALGALADADAEVKIAALRVAALLAREDLGPRISGFLSEPDARLRLAAAEALAERPSPTALAALGRASSDADVRVRVAVARALGAAATPDAVLPLLGRLDDASPDVRREVVTSLGRLGDPRAVVPLLGKAQDPAGAVRRAAAWALGLLGDPRAASALVLVLRDADPEVRVAALGALGRLRDTTAVSSVVASLAEQEPTVRSAAAYALARLASPAALAALLAELGRSDADPGPIAVALALSGPAALPALRACLESKMLASQLEGCARALARLGDESDAVRVRAALQRGALPPLVALPLLAELGGPAAVPPALEALSSPDVAVRQAAALALGRLVDPSRPDGRAVDPLRQALRARGATLAERAQLVRLLGRTGEKRVGPELSRIAREATPPALVGAALLSLGDLGPGPWEDVLLEKLDDEDGSVRTAAALALRRTGSARALPVLLARLEHGAEHDRAALGLALPSAVASTKDARTARRLVSLFARAGDGERDALLEAWAELDAPASAILREATTADRRKLGEVLVGRAGEATLIALAQDRDALVRANAAWSLGQDGSSVLSTLTPLFADRDARVAANAVASVGRVAARAGQDATSLLCPLLDDPRAIVRQNAAAGLGLSGKTCPKAALERLLRTDASARVRRAAARALASAPSSAELAAALERCAADDASLDVAAQCAERRASPSQRVEPVLVFVVPTGESVPVAGAPFALRLADGTERFGVADRRGAVFERAAPEGAVELDVLPVAGE